MYSGLTERIPYSLSRYTDLPASKWSWFEQCLSSKVMVAFDPRTAAPGLWSLSPDDTLGLVFWTKNPTNLILSQKRLEPYRVTVHMTATGWSEVEKGAPTLDQAGKLLVEAAKAFQVYWRFSPIPNLPEDELLSRFRRLLAYARDAGLRQVFVSFLQPNDQVPESRPPGARYDLLNRMADIAEALFGIQVVLCKDDRTFAGWSGQRFATEACVQAVDFGGERRVHLENCGCVLMVDPFTINESCTFGCAYCYAADKSLSPRKRNTTRRRLRVTK
jgi:hypothetical protein